MNYTVDPYEVLGVSSKASDVEIRKAYKKMALKFHPDMARNEEELERNSVKMIEINEAYEILSTERTRYDAWARQGKKEPEAGPGYEKPKPQPKPKPKASGDRLGRPYAGSRQHTSYSFNGDGDDGEKAEDGIPGYHGQYHGQHGGDGLNAGPAGHGSPGKDLNIILETYLSEDGHFEIRVESVQGNEVFDPYQDSPREIPLKIFSKVDWSSRGGCGGRGGIGGRGGDGYKGIRGQDATRHYRGTDGGPGGDGGDGGLGTSGGSGARGGHVEIKLRRYDIYLLMRVAGCDPNDGIGNRVAGGLGGRAGEHGRGGCGGRGGTGGSSYRYTTSRQVLRYDGNGYAYYDTVTDSHYVPGGSNGPCGRDGHTPRSTLYDGSNGNSGSFQIRVKTDGKRDRLYNGRYDLVLQATEKKSLSDIKVQADGIPIYEFGEIVYIQGCKLQNTGVMESPGQRVMILASSCHKFIPHGSDRLFLKKNSFVPPGASATADEGYLRLGCPVPKSDGRGCDYEPVHMKGSVLIKALQLGPENSTESMAFISDFQEEYRNFNKTKEVLKMAFPIESKSHIQGGRALSTNETTCLHLTLSNTSNHSLGSESATKRNLFVQFYYADDKDYDIPLRDIEVRGENGSILPLDPKLKTKKKTRREISFLAGGGDVRLYLTFRVTQSDTPVSARVALQANIYLQKIPNWLPDGNTETRSKKQLIQRRQIEFSIQPKFALKEETRVVLVVSTASTLEQVKAWRKLLNKRLGLDPVHYSISRYGHICAEQDVDDGVDSRGNLRETLKNKLVIVLNDNFPARPNQTKDVMRPSKLIGNVHDFDISTRFLFVGGQTTTVSHLSPASSSLNTYIAQARKSGTRINNHDLADNEKENRKTYREDFQSSLAVERKKGFLSDNVTPCCDAITVKKKFLFRPSAEKIDKLVQSRAAKTSQWLRNKDPLRPRQCIGFSHEEPTKTSKGFLVKSWNIGEIYVYTGAPRFHNPLVVIGEETEAAVSPLSSPSAVYSKQMMFAVLNSATTELKLELFVRSLKLLAVSGSESNKEDCEVIIHTLVHEFIADVTCYYDGRMEIECPSERSPLVSSLLRQDGLNSMIEESLANSAIRSVLKQNLSSLIAGLCCVAKSPDLRPWWSPMSRKHGVRKAMRECLAKLEEHWEHVLDKEVVKSDRKVIMQTARSHFKSRSWFLIRRARRRWLAALTAVNSPRNAKAYPPAPGFASQRTRIRQSFEVDTGKTYKIKKYQPTSPTASQASSQQSKLLHQLDEADEITDLTRTERTTFVSTV